MLCLTISFVKRKSPEISNVINIAEFGTYTMEFTRLSQITGNPKYKALADDLTSAAIEQPTSMPGLFPISWTVKPFAPVNTSIITIAGGGDSFYEYLIKNYILQNKENDVLLNTWQNSVESVENYMLSPTAEDPQIQYVATIGNNKVYYVAQELVISLVIFVQLNLTLYYRSAFGLVIFFWVLHKHKIKLKSKNIRNSQIPSSHLVLKHGKSLQHI